MVEKILFEDTASYKLAKVTTAFRTALEKYMFSIGLHSGQVFVLFELWREDGIRQAELARRLNIQPPTVHKMLRGMAEINLLYIEEIKGSKRSSRVFLLDGGYDIRDKVSAQWIDLEASFLKGLTDVEQQMFSGLLTKLQSTFTGQPEDGDEDE